MRKRILESSACPICLRAALHQQRVFAFDRAANSSLFLCQCDQCRAVALWPQPSSKLLEAQYARYFERRTDATPQMKVDYFLWLMRKLELRLDNARVLDLGAGEGGSIQAVNQLSPSCQVTAVEPLWKESHPHVLSADVRAETIERFLETYSGERFDVVFMFDILEHLADPRAVIESLSSRVLAPAGKIIVTTPNSDSLGRALLRSSWPQYKIEHLFYFSRRSMEILAEIGGLKTIRLEPLQKNLPLGYLLNVGAHFGPAMMQAFTRLISAITPKWLRARQFKASFGEWLWIAERSR